MEVARSCPLPINRDTTLSAQSWILHTQIAREIVETDQNQAVVCDRAALDNYAYMVSATGGHPVLDDLVTYWMGTYDYLFKVPITFSLLRDGIRDVDLEFQKKIDTIVGRLLDEKRIPYYRLPSRGRSSWMTYVQRVLELPLPGSRSRTRQQEPSAHQMKLPMKGD
jgi:hypothetical protein